MPGLSSLIDKEFIRAFKVTDAVIQNNQPLFMLTWIGSIVSLLGTVLISVARFGLSESWSLILISAVYMLGVQGITIAIHIPLNNQIQKVVVEELNDEALTDERITFERKWNYFNIIRTSLCIFVSLKLLIVLALR
jgi:uncharacterized membrane protein